MSVSIEEVGSGDPVELTDSDSQQNVSRSQLKGAVTTNLCEPTVAGSQKHTLIVGHDYL